MIHEPPRLFGFQAQGAAPIVLGEPVNDPQTIATAIRIGNPASWEKAVAAATESEGAILAVTDREILAAYRRVAHEGLFAEPASAASVAGLLHLHAEGRLAADATVVLRPDRPRPEGPGVGDRRRGQTRHGAGRSPRRSPPSWGCRCAITVRVPATSANLGPGVRLLRPRARPLQRGDRGYRGGAGRHVGGRGATSCPRTDRHGEQRSRKRSRRQERHHPMPRSVRCPHGVNLIPLERGSGRRRRRAVAGVARRADGCSARGVRRPVHDVRLRR